MPKEVEVILTFLVQRVTASADGDDTSAWWVATTIGTWKFWLTISIESDVPF